MRNSAGRPRIRAAGGGGHNQRDPHTGKVRATRRYRDGAMSVAWLADGTAILTASTDGSVRIWDAHREQRSVAELRAHVERVVPGITGGSP